MYFYSKNFLAKKKSIFLFATFIISFFYFNLTYAQFSDEGEVGLPSVETERNIYLSEPEPTSAPIQRSSTRSPAQISNGSRSGNYDGGSLSCPYAFERDLSVGMRGEDVRLLQKILNSDSRTIVSNSGAGSPGSETVVYGTATREALKRFQALFIEYIGLANGSFNQKTRTVVNALCNGKYKDDINNSNTNTNVYNGVETIQQPKGVIVETPTDKVAPRVSLQSNVNSLEAGTTFKVILNTSEEIKVPDATSFILEGASIKDLRKLSKTSYSITLVPNEDVKNITVQVEADAVEDLAGNKNEYASNEILVRIKQAATAALSPTNSTTTTTDELTKLLDKIIASVPKLSTASTSPTYDCFGRQIPISQYCQSPYLQNQGNQQSPQQQAARQAAQQQAAQDQALGALLRNQGFGGQGGPFGQPPPGGGGQPPPPAVEIPVKPTPEECKQNPGAAGCPKTDEAEEKLVSGAIHEQHECTFIETSDGTVHEVGKNDTSNSYKTQIYFLKITSYDNVEKIFSLYKSSNFNEEMSKKAAPEKLKKTLNSNNKPKQCIIGVYNEASPVKCCENGKEGVKGTGNCSEYKELKGSTKLKIKIEDTRTGFSVQRTEFPTTDGPANTKEACTQTPAK